MFSSSDKQLLCLILRALLGQILDPVEHAVDVLLPQLHRVGIWRLCHIRVLLGLLGKFTQILVHGAAQFGHALFDFFLARTPFDRLLQGFLCLTQAALGVGQRAILDPACNLPHIGDDIAQLVVAASKVEA